MKTKQDNKEKTSNDEKYMNIVLSMGANIEKDWKKTL